MKETPPPSYEESHQPHGQYPPPPQFIAAQQIVPALNQGIPEPGPPELDEHFGPFPQQAFCPICRQYQRTKVTHVSGLFTWILVFLFILFGLFCGCCLLPLCIKSCKDCEHRCSQCKTYLGTYQRVFGTRRHFENVPTVRRN